MTGKRFQIFGNVIEDMQGIIPLILCNNKLLLKKGGIEIDNY